MEKSMFFTMRSNQSIAHYQPEIIIIDIRIILKTLINCIIIYLVHLLFFFINPIWNIWKGQWSQIIVFICCIYFLLYIFNLKFAGFQKVIPESARQGQPRLPPLVQSGRRVYMRSSFTLLCLEKNFNKHHIKKNIYLRSTKNISLKVNQSHIWLDYWRFSTDLSF